MKNKHSRYSILKFVGRRIRPITIYDVGSPTETTSRNSLTVSYRHRSLGYSIYFTISKAIAKVISTFIPPHAATFDFLLCVYRVTHDAGG